MAVPRARRRPRQLRRVAAAGLPEPATPEQRAKLYEARLELATKTFDAAVARRAAERQAVIAERRARSDAAIAEVAAEQAFHRSEAAAEAAADRAEAHADYDADRAASTAFNGAMVDVAKAAIDRARGGADFVQKAATAVFALYTGALTLAFSVSDAPLPARGILPSLFLGMAIVLSSGYLAYLTRAESVPDPDPADGTPQAQLEYTRTFLSWIAGSVMNRSYFLRSAVVALGLGVVVLPAPFLALPSATTTPTCEQGQELDPTANVCLPAWPAPPAGTGTDQALRQKLYETQLAETAAARQAARKGATAPPDDTKVMLEVLVAGLAVVLLLPLLVTLVERLAGAIWSRLRGRPPSLRGRLESLGGLTRMFGRG